MKDVVSPESGQGEDMEQVYRSLLFQISEGIAGLSIGFLEQLQTHFPDVSAMVEAFTMKLLANVEHIYEKGMQTGVFKTFNVSLLMGLDNHFVMSIMTNTAPFRDQGLSLNDLVSEYLELRLSSLRNDGD